MPPANVQNAQVVEAVVSGPGSANRLFTCTGNANFFLSVSNGNQTQTFTFLVGPTLTQPQFHRAAGIASIANVQLFVQPGTTGGISHQWRVTSVDVDWDDESGQIEVRVEISASASAGASLSIQGITYYVAVLAEL